jgi:hypothetical protein
MPALRKLKRYCPKLHTLPELRLGNVPSLHVETVPKGFLDLLTNWPLLRHVHLDCFCWYGACTQIVNARSHGGSPGKFTGVLHMFLYLPAVDENIGWPKHL